MASLLDVLMGLAPKVKNQKKARQLSGPLPELLALDEAEHREWKVIRTKSMSGVSVKDAVMYAPFESTPYALRQRVHELGHAALTPETADFKKDAKKAGVSPLMMESIEDARVNSFLMEQEDLRSMFESAALDTNEYEVQRLVQGLPSWTERLKPDERTALGASLYLACANTPNAELGQKLAEACGVPIEPLAKAAEDVRGHSYEDAQQIVKKLWAELMQPPPPEMLPSGDGDQEDNGDGSPSESGTPMAASGTGSASTPAKPKEEPKEPPKKEEPKPATPPPTPPPPTTWKQPPPPASKITQEWRDQSVFAPVIAPTKDALEADRMDGEGEGDGSAGLFHPGDFERGFNEAHIEQDGHGKKIPLDAYMMSAAWGTMAVTELPLTVPLKRPRRHEAKKKRSRDDGGAIGSVHRLRLDGKVFKRKMPDRTRRRIGTLLLDASGSMHITPHDIERMLEMAPHATIAMYSGFHHPAEPGIHGKVWVLAKKRRRCSDENFSHIPGKTGGNVVDGPALRWLAKQPGPRIWVSDGGVTGRADCPGRNLIEDVKTMMRAGRIIQVPSIEHLFREVETVPDWIDIVTDVR